MKKILSSLLTVVMLVTMVAVFAPIETSAAYSTSVSTSSKYTSDEIKAIVNASYDYDFANASEMLDYELAMGYLDYSSSAGNKYTIYVNRYTGALYYVNNSTGEILTSNTYNVGKGGVSGYATSVKRMLTSQIDIAFYETSNSSVKQSYNSAQWAAEYAQISVSAIAGGLRVSYTLGDTSTRFLLPGQITAERFENDILKPMVNYYEDMVKDVLDKYDVEYDESELNFFDLEEYNRQPVYTNGCVTSKALVAYVQNIFSICSDAIGASNNDVKSLKTARDNVISFYTKYDLLNPVGASEIAMNRYLNEYIADGFKETFQNEQIAVYRFAGTSNTEMRRYSTILRLYCSDYTFAQMYDAEAEVFYVFDSSSKPVFRCSLEYTFNNDGSLDVRLPANSISFDETVYTLETITALPYFGAGDMSQYGYMFTPDGSGSILEFEDFYRQSTTLNLSIFGTDYCYSKITGQHREQITMPVYGIVSTTAATPETQALTGCGETQTTGYFAILEEGASLADLIVSMRGSEHSFGTMYAQFTPYPSDEYDLSTTISVGGSGSYYMVSESKYTGSYVIRYAMLSNYDEAGFTPDYNGMARYYREYLKEDGTLTALENVNENLPLYIEALGSMEKIEKFLTFPVTVDVPLTTFEDVEAMYDRLADAKNEFLAEADRYDALAEAEEDDMELRQSYFAVADQYRSLAEQVYNVTNVNFKLTGFANGGMYYTYPVRVKWERCLGGKNGFKGLLEASESKGFGVYPEFDFQYINNNTLFDGMGKFGNVSRMVDNRYASKQMYDSVTGEFETLYAMLITPNRLDHLYSKFLKKFTKYDVKGISVSTLGSDLNSNFDDDNPINRDQAQTYVEELLDRMSSEYSVMISKGNAYSIKYADHIVDMCTDSSQFTYSSYAIPFVGLVLHGYVNYAGSEMNYEGTPEYQLLHCIESGSALYYTLAFRNTEFLKDDEILNTYYGIDFGNWYFDLVEQYSKLNDAIGDLQTYEIVEHKTLIAERVLSDAESLANDELLKNEFLMLVEKEIVKAVSDAFDSMREDPANVGRGVKLVVDEESLIAQAVSVLNIDNDALLESDFDEKLVEIVAAYENKYVGTSDNSLEVSVSTLEYETQYNYVTDSFAFDKNYDKTDYTVDNHLVTMVTYRDAATGDEVVFILNYNIYAVEVNLDADTTYTLNEYGYVRID